HRFHDALLLLQTVRRPADHLPGCALRLIERHGRHVRLDREGAHAALAHHHVPYDCHGRLLLTPTFESAPRAPHSASPSPSWAPPAARPRRSARAWHPPPLLAGAPRARAPQGSPSS